MQDAAGHGSDRQLCIMVMGPSGVGKTSISQGIADALGAAFLEGDDYHPESNRKAMADGHPLTDEMRWPWLKALSVAVVNSAQSRATVFSCSALKRIYRDFLRDHIDGLEIVYLHADHDVILQRMQAREHFMPPSMLELQLATLEVPTDDENAITLDTEHPVETSVRHALDDLKKRGKI